MANKSAAEMDKKRQHIMYATAKMFLEKGYTDATVREISANAGIPTSAFYRLWGDKENILCELVRFVLDSQFTTATELLNGVTDDKILYYAAETTLQLHIAESNERIRELYAVAYSMPSTTKIIQDTITGKLEDIFKESLPGLETKDFYMKEIASGGIMRGFMTIPCDMWFTMDRKVASFLENTFLIYEVPKEKIRQAIKFVSDFDFEKIANQTIQSMLDFLEGKTA